MLYPSISGQKGIVKKRVHRPPLRGGHGGGFDAKPCRGFRPRTPRLLFGCTESRQKRAKTCGFEFPYYRTLLPVKRIGRPVSLLFFFRGNRA